MVVSLAESERQYQYIAYTNTLCADFHLVTFCVLGRVSSAMQLLTNKLLVQKRMPTRFINASEELDFNSCGCWCTTTLAEGHVLP